MCREVCRGICSSFCIFTFGQWSAPKLISSTMFLRFFSTKIQVITDYTLTLNRFQFTWKIIATRWLAANKSAWKRCS
jgi:hypothetical protein